MSDTGLFRGLNEAYQSFRDREADIRRERIEDEELQYQRDMREREQEDYEYGLSRRPIRERAEEAGVRMQEVGLEQAELNLDEWKKNTKYRADMNDMMFKKAKLDLDNAGIQYDLNKINQRAALGAEKYRGWKKQFMQGGTIKDLVDNFNSDDDDTNNIANVTGSAEEGWDVEFENGEVMTFADRMAVANHLELMADPQYHQTYMLNMLKARADLAAATAGTAEDNRQFMFKQQQEWDKNTYKSTDRLFGKIKEGLVDFGEPGQAAVASAINAVVNEIGAANGYQLVHAAVVDDVARMAETQLDFDPASMRKAAEKLYDAMPETDFPGGEKPDKGDDGYESAIQNLMTRDALGQIRQFRQEIMPKYFMVNSQTGQLMTRQNALSAGTDGNTITDLGLERPGTGDSGEMPAPEPAGPEPGMGTQPMQRDVMPVERETTGATITLTPSSMVAEKREEYGLEGKRGRRKKPTAAQKKRIAQDFDLTFGSLNPAQQKAWFKEFGKHLDSRRVALAKDKMGGTNVASN